MQDLRWAKPVPHCGSQSPLALPEESLREFEVNYCSKKVLTVDPLCRFARNLIPANRLTGQPEIVTFNLYGFEYNIPAGGSLNFMFIDLLKFQLL